MPYAYGCVIANVALGQKSLETPGLEENLP